jgi:hypothetical protein
MHHTSTSMIRPALICLMTEHNTFAIDAWSCYINSWATLRHTHAHVQIATSKIIALSGNSMAARSDDHRITSLTQRQALHCQQQSATVPPLSQKHRSVSVALQPPPLTQRGERCQGATTHSPQGHPPPPCGAECVCTRGCKHLGGSTPP